MRSIALRIAAAKAQEKRRRTLAARLRLRSNVDKVRENNLKSALAQRLKWKNDPIYRIKQTIRSTVRAMLSGERKTSKLIGCDRDYLIKHLEAQFYGGMTWENRGTLWCMDHRHPLSMVDLTDPVALANVCHYTNLQPLLKEHNQQKAARLDWKHPLMTICESIA